MIKKKNRTQINLLFIDFFLAQKEWTIFFNQAGSIPVGGERNEPE
jgi:hypothetical protein